MSDIQVPPVRVVFDEDMRAKIAAGIDECLSSGRVAAGKKVEEFEAFWAEYSGAKHAAATSSGGSALEVLMRAIGVDGDEVLVPTNTFVATANAVLFAGGRPRFMDADPKTLCVSLAEIERRRTPSTKGVVVVHIGGIVTPEMPAIAEWCRANNLWLVEDAAHAHGSETGGKRPGAFGIAAAYSFFATKVMTSGEGGMIVTNDSELDGRIRRYRDYGKKSQWESLYTVISANYRMGDLTAVVGLEQARRLDGFIADRAKAAARYSEALKGTLELILPSGRCSWYKYVALLPKGADRAKFKAAMKERGVSLSGGVYDLPLHAQPVFKDKEDPADYPHAEDLCARHVCLPLFPGMTGEQVLHVIDSVKAEAAKLAAAAG